MDFELAALPRYAKPPALLGVPVESHRIETIGGLLDEQSFQGSCFRKQSALPMRQGCGRGLPAGNVTCLGN
jgi:hypothetical protein